MICVVRRRRRGRAGQPQGSRVRLRDSDEGTSADRQLAMFERTGDLKAVVDPLIAETAEGVGWTRCRSWKKTRALWRETDYYQRHEHASHHRHSDADAAESAMSRRDSAAVGDEPALRRRLTTAGAIPWLIPLIDDGHAARRLRAARRRVPPGRRGHRSAAYGGVAAPLCDKTDPERDRVELALARWAMEEQKPVLGVCRGMQLINVAAGGTLYQDLADRCRRRSSTTTSRSEPRQRHDLAHDVKSRRKHISRRSWARVLRP